MSRKFLTLEDIYYILLNVEILHLEIFVALAQLETNFVKGCLSQIKMVTPAIEKIRKVESDCQEKVKQAHFQAEAIVQDALKRKKELIARAREKTQKAMEELATRAEEDARRESKKIAEREREEIEKLKEKVKPRFHKALSRVVQEMGIPLK